MYCVPAGTGTYDCVSVCKGTAWSTVGSLSHQWSDFWVQGQRLERRNTRAFDLEAQIPTDDPSSEDEFLMGRTLAVTPLSSLAALQNLQVLPRLQGLMATFDRSSGVVLSGLRQWPAARLGVLLYTVVLHCLLLLCSLSSHQAATVAGLPKNG